ncbi:hypothetical protein ACWCQK_31345 [Streptomyces sp. NPDC002306]
MRYEEKIPRTWLTITTVLYVVGIGWMAVGTVPDEWGLWLGLSAMFLVLIWVPFNAVPLSKYVYNRIQIDAQTLRVGRERIPLADLDPATVHAPSPGPVNARLVGGGWSVPMGMDSVVITTRRGEALAVPTRDGSAFLSALGSALGVGQP